MLRKNYTAWEYFYLDVHQTDHVTFSTLDAVVVIIVAADDDDVIAIEDDAGEASMMRMMGFSDFSSTKASLRNIC